MFGRCFFLLFLGEVYYGQREMERGSKGYRAGSPERSQWNWPLSLYVVEVSTLLSIADEPIADY